MALEGMGNIPEVLITYHTGTGAEGIPHMPYKAMG